MDGENVFSLHAQSALELCTIKKEAATRPPILSLMAITF